MQALNTPGVGCLHNSFMRANMLQDFIALQNCELQSTRERFKRTTASTRRLPPPLCGKETFFAYGHAYIVHINKRYDLSIRLWILKCQHFMRVPSGIL